MTSPPQWKVQLLERKRRDEEEGRRREKEEQERLARIPAWKREIIERRRARLWPGSSPSEIPAEGQAGPSLTGCTAKTGTDGTEPEACVAVATDGVVVWENIGPLCQNHFIQREKQRKSGLELEQAPLGVPGTELSSYAPGVTAILGDDMTIIESGPGLAGTKGKPPSVNGDAGQHGAYQPDLRSPLSRSAEDLNSFGRCRVEVGAEGPGQGRVTRLLSRFGQRGRPRVAERGEGEEAPARPSRSRSTENILERRGRSGAASSSVPPGCAHAPGRGRRPQSRSPPSPPRTVSAFRSHFEARSATETPGRAYPISEEAQVTRLGSRGLVGEGGGGEGGQPGPVSGGSRRPDPDSGSGPAVDIKAEPGEAQALADGEAVPPEQPQQPQVEASAPLLLSSPTSPDNVSSFSSPRPQQPVSAASSSCAEQAPAAAASCLPAVTSAAATDRRHTGESGPSGGQPMPGPERPPVPDPGPEPDATRGEPSSDMSGPQPPTAGPREVRLPAFTVRASRGRGGRGGARDTEGTTDGGQGLKGTWSPTPSRQAPGAVMEDGEGRLRPIFSPAPQRKSGRTITINPRKMATSKTPPSGNATTTENGTSGTPPAVSPATPAKKRYPTAEEIQVIGGYLTLQRSCLVKSGVSRGKVRGMPSESGNGAHLEGGRWRWARWG
ncbi:phostensin-like [Chiloscyllium plagiosum]|uniref:phostensin-like n=1 Tax=Chiloscyllium plagiosum TaxID=36176 RepID=UPI001CB80054|nr:phostensin-like [Chiloscyllium plagiosum]